MSETNRTRTRSADEREPEERTGESLVCPECNGSLVNDAEHGETVCQDCGLVVEADEIDRGPEWRAFDAAEKDEKSRVGAPTTNMMHDKGLSTNIDWRDQDAYGRSLGARQRQKMRDRKSTRLNSSHIQKSRMPSSA